MSMLDLSDIKEVIIVKMDTAEFIDRFELDIVDLVEAFSDRIREEMDALGYELGMEELPEEYEDR